jgi:hypothetical protein
MPNQYPTRSTEKQRGVREACRHIGIEAEGPHLNPPAPAPAMFWATLLAWASAATCPVVNPAMEGRLATLAVMCPPRESPAVEGREPTLGCDRSIRE